MNKIFPASNSTDPGQDCDSIHKRHPDYESILTGNHNKTMKDYIKDRIACFHSTNSNVLLLFSKDPSYEGIMVDKCFIFNLVLHFYESHTNVSTSIQSFTCHHARIYGQRFYINPKIISP